MTKRVGVKGTGPTPLGISDRCSHGLALLLTGWPLRAALSIQRRPNCFDSALQHIARSCSVATVFIPVHNFWAAEPAVFRDLELEHAECIGIFRSDHVEDLHPDVEHPALPVLSEPLMQQRTK